MTAEVRAKALTSDQVLARLPPERQARIKAAGAALIAQETALRDVRRAMGKTQVAVAKKLGISQGGVSEMEKRDDMLLSTLRSYIRALGADVYLIVEMPGLPPMRLDGLGDLHPQTPAEKPNRRAARLADNDPKLVNMMFGEEPRP